MYTTMAPTPLAHAPYFPEMRDFQHFRETHNRYAYRTQANLVPVERVWLLKDVLVKNQARYHGFNLAQPLPYLMATETPAGDNISSPVVQEASHDCEKYSSLKAMEDTGKAPWAELDDDDDDFEVPAPAPSAIITAEPKSGSCPLENPKDCTIYSSLNAVEVAGKASWADLNDEDEDDFGVPALAQTVALTAEPALKPVACEILEECKIYSALAALQEAGKDCWADLDEEDDIVGLADPCHPTSPLVETKSTAIACDTTEACDIYLSLKAIEDAKKVSWADMDDETEFDNDIGGMTPSKSPSPVQDFSPSGEEALSPISSVFDASGAEEHTASASGEKGVPAKGHELDNPELAPVGGSEEVSIDTFSSSTDDDELPSPFTFAYIATLHLSGASKGIFTNNASPITIDDDQPSLFTFTQIAERHAADSQKQSANDAAALEVSPLDKASTQRQQASPVLEMKEAQKVKAHTHQANLPKSLETVDVSSCKPIQATAVVPVIKAPKVRTKARNEERKEARRASKQIEARVWVAIAELQAADVVFADTNFFVMNGIELPDMEAFRLSVPPTEAEIRDAEATAKKAAKKARQKATHKAKKKQKGFGWMVA